MADLFPGYTTISQLGIGARSSITLVEKRQTGELFAVKRVVKRSPEDDRFLEQARIEYAVASKTDHPVLRKTHDIRRVRKWMQVVEIRVLMEYFEGETLEKVKPTEMRQVIAIFRHVAEGLDSLHRLGYVHADIKPNNILLGENEQVKIIDFGQSCALGHVKQRIQGTPDYIAPEQVRRQRITRRTDIFNVGATLYWVLTGRPYPTDIPANPGGRSFSLVDRTDAPEPREVNKHVPLSLSKLVMECCKSKPENRPGDMKELISRLDVVDHLLKKRRDKAASRAKQVQADKEGDPPKADQSE